MTSPVPRASAPRRLARMQARRPRTRQRRARQRHAPTLSCRCGRDARAPGGAGHGSATPPRYPADAGETPAHPAAPGPNVILPMRARRPRTRQRRARQRHAPTLSCRCGRDARAPGGAGRQPASTLLPFGTRRASLAPRPNCMLHVHQLVPSPPQGGGTGDDRLAPVPSPPQGGGTGDDRLAPVPSPPQGGLQD